MRKYKSWSEVPGELKYEVLKNALIFVLFSKGLAEAVMMYLTRVGIVV